jgi:hypothetical protein
MENRIQHDWSVLGVLEVKRVKNIQPGIPRLQIGIPCGWPSGPANACKLSLPQIGLSGSEFS